MPMDNHFGHLLRFYPSSIASLERARDRNKTASQPSTFGTPPSKNFIPCLLYYNFEEKEGDIFGNEVGRKEIFDECS